jgi:YggT family protein
MNLIVDILRILLNVVWWIIIVQAIMSWLIAFNVINTHNEFVRQIWGTLDRMTEPLYRPIRKILPDFGGLDLSPLVVLVGLAIIERVLLEVQYAALGM